MAEVEIQGIVCNYRDLLPDEEILYKDLPKDEQIFKRVESPFTDDELVDIANREHNYTASQKAWVEEQERIFINGIYAYIAGDLVFIPGAYWCYVNFWTLEHGDKPEYREDDREFFLFHEYLRLETILLGLTRLKGRRQGATSIGMFFMWFIAGRNEHKLCGTTSFNDTAAGDNFRLMFMYGFKAMLPCFQADFDSDSENFIRFVKPVDRKKKGVLAVKREGLNSYCDYKSNIINSYDSGRQSYNVPDEAAKRNKLNINSYWSRLYKTLVIGTNKVGFAYLPTTVGAKNEGGENYQMFYDNANQYTIDKTTGEPYGINTPNRCVVYFMPATKCYAGCIDKFGRSVIDDPKEPVLSNEGKWITEGSRTKILRERAKLEGEQLMEHRRDYPLDIYDAFAFTLGACEFSEENIQTQIKWINDNPEQCFWRQMRLGIKTEKIESLIPGKKDKEKITVYPMDDAKGGWFVLEYPNKENLFTDRGGYIEADNKLSYQIGVDTTQDRVAIAGSNPAICVLKKSCIIDGIETGLYPVALWISPTRMDIHFDEEVKKACLWFGCQANYEIDRRTDFYRYFAQENCQALLTWTPTIMKNPLKPNKAPEFGSRSGDPFQLAQMLQISKWYMDGDSQIEYNGHVHRIKHVGLLKEALHYDHLLRTKSDIFVSLQMALVAVFGEMQMPKKNTQEKPMKLLPTYRIKMVS